MTPNLTEDTLRDVMRNVPSPVTVVTFVGENGPRGVTIGSFTSVSLDPPLISFNVMLDSVAHDSLIRADEFLVHILRENQAALSEHFAIPDQTSQAQFDSISYQLNENGLPQIDDVLATVYCSHFDCIEAGDHSLLLGRVLHSTLYSTGRPLIYYRSGYHEVGSEVIPPIG